MNLSEQYKLMKRVIEEDGVCNSFNCRCCPISDVVVGGCQQESAYEEATKWIEGLKEEELFEIFL